MTIDPNTLRPARFIESDDPGIQSFARVAAGDARDPRAIALRLYYAVRDRVVYNPYVRFARPETYSAKAVLERGNGFCVPKAALLAACARVMGVPARVGFADVRNHLATPRLLEANGSDVFHWHAFAEIHLDGRWIKATPAFNLSLCEKFGVLPLEWDGENDSVFHPYDAHDRRHMEYVLERGAYDDVPFDEIVATLKRVSPKLMVDDPWGEDASFVGEAPDRQ